MVWGGIFKTICKKNYTAYTPIYLYAEKNLLFLNFLLRIELYILYKDLM